MLSQGSEVSGRLLGCFSSGDPPFRNVWETLSLEVQVKSTIPAIPPLLTRSWVEYLKVVVRGDVSKFNLCGPRFRIVSQKAIT